MVQSKIVFLAGAAAALAFPLALACHSSKEARHPEAKSHESAEQNDEQDEDADEEEALDMKSVPENVRAGAQKYFSDLSACKASRETEHGAQIYEIVGKGEGGRDVSLNISSGGSVFEVEREIPGESLPAEVAAAVASRFGGATVKKAESVEVRYYELQLTKEGKRFEVRISGTGQLMEEEK